MRASTHAIGKPSTTLRTRALSDTWSDSRSAVRLAGSVRMSAAADHGARAISATTGHER